MVGRPATGKTPVRNIRVPDGLWEAAKAKAKAEGRTLTDVIVAALHRYVASRPTQDSEDT
ncbi:YlcI/YnfO family protein [Streptomyces sp. NPDC013172]|uniref:YlcI/YnfO family protein n=1 Tax=Streptomyces atriruber TaxID=545121 RepID=A0ABV3C113_9ACTN